jgi:type IV secretory pathway TrbD component
VTRDERRELIPGYQTEIHRSLWERILTVGVPRLWAAVWLVLCLAGSLFFLIWLGFAWSLAPLGVWALGHVVLTLLTAWDHQFDDVLLAHLMRHYKSYYEAE